MEVSQELDALELGLQLVVSGQAGHGFWEMEL